jgi:hypothetical protein
MQSSDVTVRESFAPEGGNSPSRGTQILASLEGRIEPVRTPLMYRAATLVVAAAMLVLPAIYLALIALVGYGVYWHATRDLFLVTEHQDLWFESLVYAGPLIVGTVLIIFMVKPLFARNFSRRRCWLSAARTRCCMRLWIGFVKSWDAANPRGFLWIASQTRPRGLGADSGGASLESWICISVCRCLQRWT